MALDEKGLKEVLSRQQQQQQPQQQQQQMSECRCPVVTFFCLRKNNAIVFIELPSVYNSILPMG